MSDEDTLYRKCDDLVRQHVYVNQTSLVELLLEKEFVQYDEIVNQATERDEDDLRYSFKAEWEVYDLAANGPSTFVEWIINSGKTDFTENDDADEMTEALPDEWELWCKADDARDEIQANDYTFAEYLIEVERVDHDEVYETHDIFSWYVVSDYLEYWLEKLGEPILQTEYGNWWGRCTFGQLIANDSVIEQIVKRTDDDYRDKKEDSHD